MCRWHGDLLTPTRTVDGILVQDGQLRLCGHSLFRPTGGIPVMKVCTVGVRGPDDLLGAFDGTATEQKPVH